MATKAIAKRLDKLEEAAAKPTTKIVVISPPKFEQATITIVGNAPLVVHKFSTKAKNQIVATQEAGSQARNGGADLGTERWEPQNRGGASAPSQLTKEATMSIKSELVLLTNEEGRDRLYRRA